MNKLLVYNSKKIKLDKRSKKLRSLIVEGLIKSGRGHFGSAMSLINFGIYHILKFDPKKLHRISDFKQGHGS